VANNERDEQHDKRPQGDREQLLEAHDRRVAEHGDRVGDDDGETEQHSLAAGANRPTQLVGEGEQRQRAEGKVNRLKANE
jgi:hypothetical protein